MNVAYPKKIKNNENMVNLTHNALAYLVGDIMHCYAVNISEAYTRTSIFIISNTNIKCHCIPANKGAKRACKESQLNSCEGIISYELTAETFECDFSTKQLRHFSIKNSLTT